MPDGLARNTESVGGKGGLYEQGDMGKKILLTFRAFGEEFRLAGNARTYGLCSPFLRKTDSVKKEDLFIHCPKN